MGEKRFDIDGWIVLYSLNRKLLYFFLPDFDIDGKCLACTYRAKFVEVSVGINHNVDELLVGILQQIRLKKEQNPTQVSIGTTLGFCSSV